MQLFVYDKITLEPVLEVDALYYNASVICDADGGTITMDERWELSSARGVDERLRAEYELRNPRIDARLTLLEELLADILFGGDAL